MWKKLIKLLFAPKCPRCKKGKFDIIDKDKFTGENKFMCDHCGYIVWQ